MTSVPYSAPESELRAAVAAAASAPGARRLLLVSGDARAEKYVPDTGGDEREVACRAAVAEHLGGLALRLRERGPLATLHASPATTSPPEWQAVVEIQGAQPANWVGPSYAEWRAGIAAALGLPSLNYQALQQEAPTQPAPETP